MPRRKTTKPTQKIGNYELESLIGTGSFSRVYRARDIRNGNVYAVKQIDMSKVTSHLAQRIEYEINCIKNFRHKNIVQLCSVIDDSAGLYKYLVMEYCDKDFNAVLAEILTEEQTKYYFQQIYDALKYLRNKNITHRDLKPENILIQNDKDGKNIVKLADFGFARELADQCLAETLCGSPLYMAPEILDKRGYTPKADLWSLGLILFECIYGIHPFSNIGDIISLIDTIRKMKGFDFPSVTLIGNNKVSLDCRELLDGLLQKDDTLRYTWEEFFAHPWFERKTDLSQSLENLYYYHDNISDTPLTKLTESIIENYQENSPTRPIAFDLPSPRRGVSLGQSFVNYLSTSIELLTDSFRSFNSL